MEATLLMQKNPSHALLDPHGPRRPPPLWLPGESLLGGAGETHQEDGWPPDQPPQAGWSSGWVKGVSLGSTTRDFWSLLDFEEPLWCQGFYMKPLSAATRQLFNSPGALSQTLDQMQTIRLFAEKNKVNEKLRCSQTKIERYLLPIDLLFQKCLRKFFRQKENYIDQKLGFT